MHSIKSVIICLPIQAVHLFRSVVHISVIPYFLVYYRLWKHFTILCALYFVVLPQNEICFFIELLSMMLINVFVVALFLLLTLHTV
jgi:hypothetical protein